MFSQLYGNESIPEIPEPCVTPPGRIGKQRATLGNPHVFGALSWDTVMGNCHGALSWGTVMVHCHGALSWCTVMVHCHGALSWSTYHVHFQFEMCSTRNVYVNRIS